MGISGAALATLVSVVIGTVWLFAYFLPAGSYLKIQPRDWPPRLRLWWNMVKIGLAFGLAPMPGFQLWWVWHMSVASVTLRAVMITWLVRREFHKRPEGVSSQESGFKAEAVPER